MSFLTRVFPFEMTIGDRIFFGIATGIALLLVFFRVAPDASIFVGYAIWVITALVIITWG